MNNFLVSWYNYYFLKQTFDSINIKKFKSKKGECVLFDEDKLITKKKIIPDSFDSTEQTILLMIKLDLEKGRSKAQ